MTKVKDEKKQLELNLSKKEAELAKTQEQLAAALSRIEISSAAAVGEVQKLICCVRPFRYVVLTAKIETEVA